MPDAPPSCPTTMDLESFVAASDADPDVARHVESCPQCRSALDEIRAARSGVSLQAPDVDRVVETLLDHMAREIALKGPRTGLNRMKRHFASYLRGYPDVAELRKQVFATNDTEVLRRAFEDYRQAHSGARIERATALRETVS